jgi:hypothetical protein
MAALDQKRRFRTLADDFRSSPMNRHSQYRPACLKSANGSPSFDHLVAMGEHLSAMVIRAARLAAMLLRIARGLRHAE